MESFFLESIVTHNLFLLLFMEQLYGPVVSTLESQPIHRAWPSLRVPENHHHNIIKNVTTMNESAKGGHSRNVSQYSSTVFYGSPICIGRCLILQVYWSNWSTSSFDAKFEKLLRFRRSSWDSQHIHRVWPSLRETEMFLNNSTEPRKAQIDMDKKTANNSNSTKMLVYGSPICIGDCLIIQIYWRNSSSSVLGIKLPRFPTFPRPREVST